MAIAIVAMLFVTGGAFQGVPGSPSPGQPVGYGNNGNSTAAGGNGGQEIESLHLPPRLGSPGFNPVQSFCFGDGADTQSSCPCGNLGATNGGCDNSAHTGGGALHVAGSIHPDMLVLRVSGALSSTLCMFFQGDVQLPNGVPFGDGVRCVGGVLRPLYVKQTVGGVATAPESGEAPISEISAALGDPLVVGTTRFYQVHYRDPDLAFCPAPLGSSWNITNAIAISW